VYAHDSFAMIPWCVFFEKKGTDEFSIEWGKDWGQQS